MKGSKLRVQRGGAAKKESLVFIRFPFSFNGGKEDVRLKSRRKELSAYDNSASFLKGAHDLCGTLRQHVAMGYDEHFEAFQLFFFQFLFVDDMRL